MDELYRIDGHKIDLSTLTNYYLLGATDSEVAFFLGVDEKTLKHWLEYDPFIANAAMKGGAIADGLVAQSLFRCAVGYKGREAKVVKVMEEIRVVEYEQYYPPSVDACKTWLSRRRPEVWGQKADSAAKPVSEAERESKANGIRKELEGRYTRLVAAGEKGGLDKRPIAGRA